MHRPNVAVILALAGIGAVQAGPAATPTFSKDVAPILYRNCATCHRPGDIAPMALLTYEQARPWAKSIREKISLGQMPPWHADAPRGVFSNDRRLSDADKETLIRWASAGAPEGNPKDRPAQPQFTEGWEIGTPDVVSSIPKDYEVPATGTIHYQYFTVPTNFTDDKWVRAIEVRPGERSVVHHVLVFCREPNAPVRPAAFVPIVPEPPAAARQPGPQQGRQEGLGRRRLIATTAPGPHAMTVEPGTTTRVDAGAVLTFQIHYTANGKAASARTSVGMIFAKEPPRQEIRNSA